MISVETPDTPAILSVLYMYRDPCHVISGQNIYHLVWSEPLETSLNETLVYWEILCWLGAGGCVQWAGAALGSCPFPCLPGSPRSSCSLTPCMCSWLCWKVNVSVDLHRDHRDNSTQSCIVHQQQPPTAATAATTLLARVLRPAASTTRLRNPISRLYREFSISSARIRSLWSHCSLKTFEV